MNFAGLFFFVLLIVGARQAASQPPELTVWLIPSENAGPNDMARGEDIRRQVDAFNSELRGSGVTVLNTIEPLAMKLVSWNPAFAVPNASVVLGQRRTLEALRAYASDKNLTLRVRFITWDEAFGLISELDTGRRGAFYPDIIQIGSTWAAHMAARGLLASRPGWETDLANWEHVRGQPASVLPYTSDVRLLFYWRRLPSAAADSPPLVLNTSTWQSVIESLRRGTSAGETLAFATGLTLNVLHDYAPLVWAGGEDFIRTDWFGTRVDLTSPAALAIPQMLARASVEELQPGEPRRFIAFQESSHQEASRVFVNGGYRSILEPAAFIQQWRKDFNERATGRSFWDYAAAAVPPLPFKGGSYLAVLRGGDHTHAAFALADYLATNPFCTEILAEGGHLPATRPGYGVDVLVASLSGGKREPEADQFISAVQNAIHRGRTYPQLPMWPAAIENRQVLEALQTVWRRMSERDEQALAEAAASAERTINARMHWWYRFVERTSQAWQTLTLLLLAAAAVAFQLQLRHARAERRRINAEGAAMHADQMRTRAEVERIESEKNRVEADSERLRAERTLILLLHLHRAHRHDAAKFLGDNFHDLADRAADEQWPISLVIEQVRDLSSHFRDRLAPHVIEIAEHQLQEMLGESSPLSISDLTLKAWDGARYIYRARKLSEPPEVRFVTAGLGAWRLDQFPYALVVVLEEWFLNTLWHVAGYGIVNPLISVVVDNGVLIVESAGSMAEDDAAILATEPTSVHFAASRQGLPLIRNILYFAYAVRASIERTEDDRRLRLCIPVRLTSQLAAGRS